MVQDNHGDDDVGGGRRSVMLTGSGKIEVAMTAANPNWVAATLQIDAKVTGKA